MAKQARPHSWRGPKTTVIPMHASCLSAECSALLKPSVGGRRTRTRTPSASATRARSTKNKYTVSASKYVAIVTKQAHGARRRYAPVSFAHDRRNFASIFTPRKMRRNFCDGGFCGAGFCSLSLIFFVCTPSSSGALYQTESLKADIRIGIHVSSTLS